MIHKYILVENENRTALVTLNRPDKMNAISPGVLDELAHLLDEMAEDDDTRTLILTGAGRAFSSGADLSGPTYGTEFNQEGISRRTRLEPFVRFGRVVRKLVNFPKPVVAAINGIAAGAGLTMALACDIRIASEKARFSCMFVRRGLIPDCGTTYLLPRVVGTAKALELMWTGDTVDVQEAYRVGLVSQVVPAGELLSRAKEFGAKLAKSPAVSVELTKKLVHHGLEDAYFPTQIACEAWAQSLCIQTDDFREGIRAFVEKREPRFEGR